MDAGSPPPLRIIIFPWLAFGHMLPYLELAERLATRGHSVSFLSTPGNIARLPPLRAAPAPCVDLVALPLPRVEGLPDGVESTNDVPSHKRELHWKAFDGLATPFAQFLATACAEEGTRPHFIMADSFHYFVAAAALEHKVPCAQLLPTAAFMAAAFPRQPSEHQELAASLSEQPSVRPLLHHEREDVASLSASDGPSGMSVAQRWSLTEETCMLGVIRSCPEWEPECFQLAVTLFGKPIIPLGLLPPSPDGGRLAARTNREDATVVWLDAQPLNSVVYVALGSEVPLQVEQVHELALGLELAGTRFLWALRKPDGVLDADILPPGFQERTRSNGLVTMGWVPQMSILAHDAVGGFLTHCGRNSLIEGLLFGHPLIMLPIFGDQGPNARLMEGKKVGMQVARNENDGSFDRHGLASAVRAVMLEEEDRGVFVANALKMQKIVADNDLHERYIDELIQQLRFYTTAAHVKFSTSTGTSS